MGKETVESKKRKKGLRFWGKVGPLHWCGSGRAGVGKTAKSPEILPGRGTRECKGLVWE